MCGRLFGVKANTGAIECPWCDWVLAQRQVRSPSAALQQQIALREMNTSERCVPQRFAMAFIPSMCLPRR
jgi:hypothetical protein